MPAELAGRAELADPDAALGNVITSPFSPDGWEAALGVEADVDAPVGPESRHVTLCWPAGRLAGNLAASGEIFLVLPSSSDNSAAKD